MKLRDLATKLGADLSGAGDIEITGARGVREAGEGHITYIADRKHLNDLKDSHASAAIVPLDATGVGMPVLCVENPRLTFARTLELLYGAPYSASGISDRAVIGSNVVFGADPSVHPYVVVEDGAKLGRRVTLYPGVYVGRDTSIGDDCIIYSNVSIREGVTIGSRVIIHAGAVIGSDGFGFVTESGMHHKIPQVGGVIIEDDVEIGANCTIDRATLGNTLIKGGTKIDNLVHIAHNVTVGEHCLLAGQVGIAGSTTLGNYVVLAGQVGVADHVSIGDQVIAAAKSGIIKDIPQNEVVGGYYAMPQREWLKVQAVLPKLPELKKRIVELENQIKDLQKKLSGT